MELPESRRGTFDDWPKSRKEKFEARSVVVAVDATKELTLAALQYALRNFVRPGDKLHLLGILHRIRNPRGFKQKADLTLESTGTNNSIIQEEIRRKKAEFEKCMTDPEIRKLVGEKEVFPVVHTAAWPDRKVVAARQALKLRATWLILDLNLKKKKNYLMEYLNCNLVLMKPKNEAGVIRLEVHENRSLNQSGAPSIVPSHLSQSNIGQSSSVTTPNCAPIRTSIAQVVESACSPRRSWKTSSNSPRGKSILKFKPKANFSYMNML